MEQGWDSDVKRFFSKILNSISLALLWALAAATAGIYFQLGWAGGKPIVFTFLFYIVAVLGLLGLIRYLYRTWKKD
ncbi:MAG: hypothetical protein HYZ15_10890 [Sphingobacteriales bacterium]|nr:hypothetical protein [Sphingobacteriales bacterium]